MVLNFKFKDVVVYNNMQTFPGFHMINWIGIEGIVHPKMKFMSLITRPHVFKPVRP